MLQTEKNALWIEVIVPLHEYSLRGKIDLYNNPNLFYDCVSHSMVSLNYIQLFIAVKTFVKSSTDQDESCVNVEQ